MPTWVSTSVTTTPTETPLDLPYLERLTITNPISQLEFCFLGELMNLFFTTSNKGGIDTFQNSERQVHQKAYYKS